MTVPQTLDPPRDAYAAQPKHIPQVPKSRIPQQPAPASTHADSDVDEPRHAVVSVTIWLHVCNLLELF